MANEPTIGFSARRDGRRHGAQRARKHVGAFQVFDMSADAMAAVVAAGALATASVEALAQVADVVILSLPGGKQVASVCETIAAHAKPGTIVIDMSTTGVDEARAVHASLAQRDIAFADAPVARARAAAEAGTLSIMVGADEALFARITRCWRTWHRREPLRRGRLRAGGEARQQHAIVRARRRAGRDDVVSERAGVPPATLLDVLAISSADSFALRNHGMKAMLPRSFPRRRFPRITC